MWVLEADGTRKRRVWIAAPAGTASPVSTPVTDHERVVIMYEVDLGGPALATNLTAAGCYADLAYRHAWHISKQGTGGLLYVSGYDTQVNPFDSVLNAKVETATGTIQHYVSRGLASAIGQRLIALVDAAREEYPETDIPNQHVLESAIQFLRSRKNLQVPLFALTSVGGVWVEWRGAAGRAAALEFKRDGTVNLAAFYPDPEQPLQMSSRAMSMSWQSASREIRDNAELSWLFAA